MRVTVVDASVIIELLAGDDTSRRATVRTRLTGGDPLHVPAHLDIEVVSALRSLAHGNRRLAAITPALIGQLLRMPLRRTPLTGPAARRVWQLRDTMTAYDAGYVALAEQLGAVLLTCDPKYHPTTGLRCAVELLL